MINYMDKDNDNEVLNVVDKVRKYFNDMILVSKMKKILA